MYAAVTERPAGTDEGWRAIRSRERSERLAKDGTGTPFRRVSLCPLRVGPSSGVGPCDADTCRDMDDSRERLLYATAHLGYDEDA
jgi:hypothetical protein